MSFFPRRIRPQFPSTCPSRLQPGRTPTIFGDGQQSRDFVAIRNVALANLLGAEGPADKVAGRVFNIGGGASINLLDLMAELNRQTGQSARPNFAPARAGDVLSSRADISAARTDLGYEPKVTWQEGLRETLGHYRMRN